MAVVAGASQPDSVPPLLAAASRLPPPRPRPLRSCTPLSPCAAFCTLAAHPRGPGSTLLVCARGSLTRRLAPMPPPMPRPHATSLHHHRMRPTSLAAAAMRATVVLGTRWRRWTRSLAEANTSVAKLRASRLTRARNFCCASSPHGAPTHTHASYHGAGAPALLLHAPSAQVCAERRLK